MEIGFGLTQLPFSAFSFPVPAREVLQNIEELIPSFRGVKFSGSDLLDFGQCVSRSPPHWSLLYGMDEVSFSSFLTLSDLLKCDLKAGANCQRRKKNHV